MATQIDHLAFETVKTVDPDDLIYFLRLNRKQKNAGGKVISFTDFKFLLSTLGVQSVTGNLVDNTIPQYPVVNQKVSTDANNDSILGTDGLLYTPERVQSVTGNLVDNTDPLNPIIDQAVSTDSGNSAILGTDGLVYVPIPPPGGVQSVTGNLVDNTDPSNPIIDQSVSTDAGNDSILGTDGLLFTPERVQSVTGNLVDNTDPLNPVVDAAVSADANNDTILGTDNLPFTPQRVQSVTGDNVDNTDPLNPIIKAFSNLALYPTTASSSIPTYNRLVTNILDPDFNNPDVNVPTGPITTTGVLLSKHTSDPGIFIGNPGVITVSAIFEIRRISGTGSAEFYFEAYHRNNLGVETLIGISGPSTPVNVNVYTEYNTAVLFNNGTFNVTDRIVLKFYMNRIAGGSNPSFEILYGGMNAARILFPVPASIIGDLPIIIGTTSVQGGTNGYVLQVQSGKVNQTDLKTVNGQSLFGTGDIAAGVTARHDWQSPYSYMGTAPLGTLDTSPTWLISRITINLDGSTLVQTATGAWTNRYSLIYT